MFWILLYGVTQKGNEVLHPVVQECDLQTGLDLEEHSPGWSSVIFKWLLIKERGCCSALWLCQSFSESTEGRSAEGWFPCEVTGAGLGTESGQDVLPFQFHPARSTPRGPSVLREGTLGAAGGGMRMSGVKKTWKRWWWKGKGWNKRVFFPFIKFQAGSYTPRIFYHCIPSSSEHWAEKEHKVPESNFIIHRRISAQYLI